jgi:hypothetical protein
LQAESHRVLHELEYKNCSFLQLDVWVAGEKIKREAVKSKQ